MLDCEGSFNSVEPIRSLSEMEPSGVSVEGTKSCTNKDHCQSVTCLHLLSRGVGMDRPNKVLLYWGSMSQAPAAPMGAFSVSFRFGLVDTRDCFTIDGHHNREISTI